jgi:putative hydrolase of the HAD superfamily
MTQGRVAAVLLDCGDTLVDEATEQKTTDGVSLAATLIPGAAELVHTLKARGYPLGLVADGPRATFVNNLGPYGLFDLFDAYAISAEVGVEKPAPAIFEYALGQLGIARADYCRVVMVGNYLARDIAGANSLGLISVWLDWAPRRPKTPATTLETPDYTIRQPLALLDTLAAIEAAPTDGHSDDPSDGRRRP